MIKNEWAMIDYEAIAGYTFMCVDLGPNDGIDVRLDESVLINELHSLQHYLRQEANTERKLKEIREILEYPFMSDNVKLQEIGDIMKWIFR